MILLSVWLVSFATPSAHFAPDSTRYLTYRYARVWRDSGNLSYSTLRHADFFPALLDTALLTLDPTPNFDRTIATLSLGLSAGLLTWGALKRQLPIPFALVGGLSYALGAPLISGIYSNQHLATLCYLCALSLIPTTDSPTRRVRYLMGAFTGLATGLMLISTLNVTPPLERFDPLSGLLNLITFNPIYAVIGVMAVWGWQTLDQFPTLRIGVGIASLWVLVSHAAGWIPGYGALWAMITVLAPHGLVAVGAWKIPRWGIGIGALGCLLLITPGIQQALFGSYGSTVAPLRKADPVYPLRRPFPTPLPFSALTGEIGTLHTGATRFAFPNALIDLTGELDLDIRRAIQRGDPTYRILRDAPTHLVIPNGTTHFNPPPDFLAQLYTPSPCESGLCFTRTRPLRSLSTVYPLSVAYTDSLTLVGYTTDSETLPLGDLTRLRLEWRVTRETVAPFEIEVALFSPPSTVHAKTTLSFLPARWIAESFNTYHLLTIPRQLPVSEVSIIVSVAYPDQRPQYGIGTWRISP